MDCPMPHGPVVMLTFPTVQGFCQGCLSFLTTCPEEVHPSCHATWRLMRSVSAWAAMATNREVALMFEISDNTVRRYDKIVLDTRSLEFLMMSVLLSKEKGKWSGRY
jgi:hypothetical protein